MTLRDIAFKNIKGNFSKYMMYYLSNTLVVMVFFIFANFIFTPDIAEVGAMGTKGRLASQAMMLCEYVIIIFSLFFTSYSISSFLKSREKEFGLLALFGLTKREIRKFVMYENMVVSIVSIITGLLLGVLFSRLFFMAVSAILLFDSATAFTISTKAVLITAISFLVIFQGTSFITTLKIKNNNIVQLLKGARVPKKEPNFSIFKAVLAILFIAIGYGLAFFSGIAIIITMFPILFFTVTGTYFLFSQFSVYFTRKLKSKEGIYYNGINMLTLSQIIYKIKDNATILFIVSVLGAVTLTASATVYSYQQSLKTAIEQYTPQDINYIESGEGAHEVLPQGAVEEVLNKHSLEISFHNQTPLIKASNLEIIDENSDYKNFYVISNQAYNALAEQYKRKKVTLSEGEAILNVYNFKLAFKSEEYQKDYVKLNINNQEMSFTLVDNVNGSVLNADNNNTNIVVINDKEFESLLSTISPADRLVYYGYSLKNWQRAETAMEELTAMVPEDSTFYQRVSTYVVVMQSAAIILFIGSFIAILFFLATGSIIYFKMFNELYEDRQQFISLRRIGMTNGETKRIVSQQTKIIFFLPFLVIFTHSAFAIKTLSDLLLSNLTLYFLTVAGIYLAFQTLYYFVAKYMYMRQIKRIFI